MGQLSLHGIGLNGVIKFKWGMGQLSLHGVIKFNMG